ncbi:MAG: hypothetical protein ACLR93_11770 [Alistipes onderdonkii]
MALAEMPGGTESAVRAFVKTPSTCMSRPVRASTAAATSQPWPARRAKASVAQARELRSVKLTEAWPEGSASAPGNRKVRTPPAPPMASGNAAIPARRSSRAPSSRSEPK